MVLQVADGVADNNIYIYIYIYIDIAALIISQMTKIHVNFVAT